MTALRTIVLLIATLLLSTRLFAQIPPSPNRLDEQDRRTGHWTILLDRKFNETTLLDSTVYYRVVNYQGGKPFGKVRDFFRSTNIKQWEGFVEQFEPTLIIGDGEVREYHENGRLKTTGWYRNGKLNGPSTVYDENGIVSARANYLNDAAHGTWTYYYHDGVKKGEANFRNGLENGLMYLYHPNGGIRKKVMMVDGKEDGLVEDFYENGNPNVIHYTTAGVINGSYQWFNEKGILEDKGQYLNGAVTGKWEHYYEDGTTLQRKGAKDSLGYQGRWTYYHRSGATEASGNFKNDLKTGKWRYFHPDGSLSSLKEWVRDTLNGTQTDYYPGGIIRSFETQWKMGRKDGPSTWYFDDGTIDQVETFREGIANGPVYNYHPGGGLRDTIVQRNGKYHGRYISYHDNGRVRVEGTFDNGIRTGRWNWFYPDGQPNSFYHFVEDKATGPFTDYFPSGVKKRQGEQLNGNRNGWIRYWYANGKLKMEGKCINDLGEGKWTYYDSTTGSVSSVRNYHQNRMHGRNIMYANGGRKKVSLYLHGFEVEPYSIKDSIRRLIHAEDYSRAERSIKWLKQVIRRGGYRGKVEAAFVPLLLSDLAFDQKNDSAAAKWNDQYLSLVRASVGERTAEFSTGLNSKANIRLRQGRSGEAATFYQRSLTTDSLIGALGNYWITATNLAALKWRTTPSVSAEQVITARIAGFESIKGQADPWTLMGLYALGNFHYQYTNQNKSSIPGLETFIKRAAACPDQRVTGLIPDAAKKLGNEYAYLGSHGESLRWRKYAIKLIAQDGSRFRDQLNLLSAMALNHRNLGHPDSTLMMNERIMELIGSNADRFPDQYADALWGKADILKSRGAISEAFQLAVQANDLLERAGMTGSDVHFNNLVLRASLLTQLARYEASAKLLSTGKELMLRRHGEQSGVFARTLKVIAKVQQEMHDWPAAEASLEQSKAILETSDLRNSQDYRSCLTTLAYNCYWKGQLQKGLGYNTAALRHFATYGDQSTDDHLYALEIQSMLWREQKQYDSAEYCILKALRISEQIHGGSSIKYLSLRTSFASLLSARSLHAKALPVYIEVADAYKKANGESSVAYMRKLLDVGISQASNGNHQNATSTFRSILETLSANGQGRSVEALETTKELAMSASALNDQATAAMLQARCVELSRNLYGKEHAEYAGYLLRAGLYHTYQRNYPLAEQYLEQAVEALGRSTEGMNTAHYGQYLSQLANVKSRRNMNQEAEELMIRAIKLVTAEKTTSPGYFIDAFETYADFLEKMGRYREAEEKHLEIIEVARSRYGKDYYYHYRRSRLVSLYWRWGRLDQAMNEAEEILAYVESELSPTDPLVQNINNLVGLIHYDRRAFSEAEKHFNTCLEISNLRKTEEPAEKSNLGNSLLALNRISEAAPLLLRAKELLNRQSNPADPLAVILQLDNYAALLQAQGKWGEAEKAWMEVTKKALQYTFANFYFLSDEEKAQFWNQVKEVFEYFNSFAVARSITSPAILGAMYDNRLATKAILLSTSNKVRNRILGSHDPDLVRRYYDWTEIREQLAQLYSQPNQTATIKKRIDSLASRSNDLEKEMSITAEDLDADRGPVNVHWKDVQRTLTSDEAAIEIIRFRHFDRYVRDSVLYAALVLTANTTQHPQLVMFPEGRQMEERSLRFYRNAILSGFPDTLSYITYWKPLESALKGKTRVYLSLDGVYNEISPGTLSYGRNRYLIDDKSLTIVSNTRDLLSMKRKKNTASMNSATLFGHPTFFLSKGYIAGKFGPGNRDFDLNALDDRDDVGIKELPGTRTEVEMISGILAASKVETISFMDAQASEKALKSVAFPGILHVATHGFFKEDFDRISGEGSGDFSTSSALLRSGIILSGASNFIKHHIRMENEDGILTAYEASNLNLENTGLVVLSACETGKGELQNGEGVYGLQRAFQTAGARSVLMSLWKVDDNATQELMSTFYRSWMSGLTKAEAFRNAQLIVKKKFGTPYYWGAFVMMGD